MQKKLVVRLSNNIGNQMFMYASAYSFSKQLERELYIDDETSYARKKNIYKYELNLFNLTSKLAPNELKFLDLSGYLKRKIIKKMDYFRSVKSFYIEPKSKDKISSYDNNFLKNYFGNNLFLEGHFESEKYFINYKNEIINEFTFKLKNNYLNNKYYKMIKNSNAISICIRQNRFSENVRNSTTQDNVKSKIFNNEQIKFIKKSINILKTKISNPKFFLWSNNFEGLSSHFPQKEFTLIENDKHLSKENVVILNLFLMTQAKHFIVIPSCYNWWGCWLSSSNEKIVFRPSDKYFSDYRIGNKDFWPEKWKIID